MTPKQQRFPGEYIIDLNATAAAERSGYSKKTAYSIGHELLKKPEIQEAIQKAQKERQVRTEITADRVLLEYKRLAFLDPGVMLDEDGNLVKMSDMPEDARRCIGGLEVAEITSGEKPIGTIKKVKLISKTAALNDLAKHLGIFEKDNEQKAPIVNYDVVINTVEDD